MNKETRVKYELAKMYEFVCQIDRICARYNYNYNEIVQDEMPYNAIAMGLVQLGERANHIKTKNPDSFKNNPMNLQGVISMRNKVVHGYTLIDKNLFIEAISVDIPYFKEYIESEVIQEVLDDPYCLYEEEYEEVVQEIKKYNKITQENDYDR